MKHSTRATATLFLISTFLCPAVSAMFERPTLLPIDRIVANIEARLEANPDDHEAIYTLARAHYLAFFNGISMVPTWGDGQIVSIAPNWAAGNVYSILWWQRAQEIVLERWGLSAQSKLPRSQRRAFQQEFSAEEKRLRDANWNPDPLSIEEHLAHAGLAVNHFKEAIKMAPENGLYHLGLASLYLQYVEFRKSHELTDEPEALKVITISDARRFFYSAYVLSADRDLKLLSRLVSGLGSPVSYEAGRAFLKLIDAGQDVPPEEMQIVPSVNVALFRLENMKSGVITPVIFSMEQHTSLSDLLDADATVVFDLDGDGTREQWPWVKCTTGFLVWDDLGTGRITSGRQLFGSVTWWLFFRNGYQALDALDDNRDGSLAGSEMRGIAVWFDRDGDGVSKPSEIVSLKSLDVTAIRTQPTGEDGGAPMNSEGLILSNGRALATYDWIASPVD